MRLTDIHVNQKCFLLGLILIIWPGKSFTQIDTSSNGIQTPKIYVIDSIMDEYKNLEEYTYILEDPINRLSYEQVISNEFQNEFIPTSGFTTSSKFQVSNWLRLTLKNELSTEIELAFQPGNNNDYPNGFQIYVSVSDDSIKSYLTGYIISDSINDEIIKGTNTIKVKLSGKQDPESIQTIYIKFLNVISGPSSDIRLFNFDYYKNSVVAFKQKRNTILGFFQGVFWILILYSFIVYLFTKDKSYLFYALFLVFGAFYILKYDGFLLDLFTWNKRHLAFIYLIFMSIGIYFYQVFKRKILYTQQLIPRWDPLLKVAIGITLFVLLIEIAFMVFPRYLGRVMIFASYFVAIPWMILHLLVLIKLAFIKDTLTRIFVMGDILFIVATATNLLLIVYNKTSIDELPLLAILLLSVFLLIALCYKTRRTELSKQKIRVRLIEQLKEKRQIQEKINVELEQTVKERTSEILKSKEEIEAQRDLLHDQKNEIVKKNKSVKDSIRYASRIQRAILPQKEIIRYFLPNSFILNKPRDIVSGDFYFVGQKNGYVVVAIADCTGHGVPGAFMSMLGTALLNDIVRKLDKASASLILDELRERIIMSLHQTGEMDEAKDGMDIALCVFEDNMRKVQYAGANNPLYIVRDSELIEVKSDNMPVGIDIKAGKSFTNNELALQKGDSIFMFTDGYADQFGGPASKKFGYKRFKQLLLEVRDKIMYDQKEVLEDRFHDWKNGDEQIDDVLVMGIKI